MSLGQLENIIITIDTREQNQKRISAVEKWGELHGAIIEHRALKHLDYHILGDYKGHDVNIGIEAKALSQFCSDDYALNKEKLFAACSIYDHVGIFIETGNYEFVVSGFGETNISCTVKKDLTITGKLAIFEGACSTLSKYGIHVRQLRSEAHFPYAIENLITYSIHEHDLISAPDYLTQYKMTLLTFLTPLQMRKIVQAYPNMFWLCSAGEDAYQTIIGKKAGKKLYDFIRNPLLVTPEWSNSHFPDGTESEAREYNTQDVIKAVTDYLSGFPEGRTADEICTHFNLNSGDEDKEKLLECLKKMAYNNIITNTVTGLLHLPKLQSHCDPAGNFSKTYNTTLPLNHIPAVDNDKTGKLVEIIPLPQPEPKTKGKAPVLSESKLKILPDTELDVLGLEKPVVYIEGEEKPLSNHRMSVRPQLEAYLQQPHTLQECIDKLDNFQKGTVWEHIQRMKKEGVIVEFDDKSLVMTR